MGVAERKSIIEQIERLRNSKVITYVITSRPAINTMIQTADLREIYRHFEGDLNKKYDKIDLFIYSLGGESTTGWALVNLIREFTDDFSVLVPYHAFSCATSIALGANEIVMGKMGTLGPVDPKVSNEFNPKDSQGKSIQISVEDVSAYFSLLEDKVGINDEKSLAQLSETLATDIKPLALGNAYRHYLKARDDARKLLELHLDPVKDKVKIDRIVEILVEKLYYHGHHVNRKEAKSIGLNIVDVELITTDDLNLADLIWNLYTDYETELKMNIPYADVLPTELTNTNNATSRKAVIDIPVKLIESNNLSSRYVISQTWKDFGLPVGTKLLLQNNQCIVAIPTSNPQQPYQPLPLMFQGVPVIIEDKLYEKREESYWKSEKQCTDL